MDEARSSGALRRAAARRGIAEAALAKIEPSRWRGSTRRPKAAKASPTPALESAMTDVWADGGNAWRN